MNNKPCIALVTCLSAFLAISFPVFAADNEPGKTVKQLQADALVSDLAWDTLASLTSEVGPRMGGSDGDLLAVDWAVDNMQKLGFDRVWKEPVTFPRWVRNHESAAVMSAEKDGKRIVVQPLAITAIGGSPSSNGTLLAEITEFDSIEALESASNEAVKGKIVFLSTRMRKTHDGAGYGETVSNRSRGPFVAAEKGAAALLIRSVGTDNNRLPHTGMMSGSLQGPRVPSAAISNPDADNLMLLVEKGAPVVVQLDLDVGFDGEATSYNVVGEFNGRDDSGKHILIGAHLDSWDLGTGAVDDGAGVALVMAAAKMVADLPTRPRNATRVVLYANEEQGIYGGKEYARKHAEDLSGFIVGAESDLGADRIYRLKASTLPTAQITIDFLAHHLKALGIVYEADKPAYGGADVGQMRRLGMPAIDLNQDASRYFDLHHTANDTLDKVNPQNLQQNLAAWVTLVFITADSTDTFGPLPVAE
jgi:Zn-dependent M28 family amino/carboxypeptidase